MYSERYIPPPISRIQQSFAYEPQAIAEPKDISYESGSGCLLSGFPQADTRQRCLLGHGQEILLCAPPQGRLLQTQLQISARGTTKGRGSRSFSLVFRGMYDHVNTISKKIRTLNARKHYRKGSRLTIHPLSMTSYHNAKAPTMSGAWLLR